MKPIYVLAWVLRSIFVLALCSSLTACASRNSHENFKSIMNAQIGRNADAPTSYPGRYREHRIGTRTLPNGNIEEGFPLGSSCRYYFEIEKASRKIVGWRYEGTQDDCAIRP